MTEYGSELFSLYLKFSDSDDGSSGSRGRPALYLHATEPTVNSGYRRHNKLVAGYACSTAVGWARPWGLLRGI